MSAYIKKYKTISLIVFAVIFIAAGAFLYISRTPASDAIHNTATHPPHNHISLSCSTDPHPDCPVYGRESETAYTNGGPLGGCNNCWDGTEGDTQEEVVEHLQRDLRFLDGIMEFYEGDVNVDGFYSENTAEAVAAFQNNRDIQVDGITGNQTFAQMETSLFSIQFTYRMQAGLDLRFLIWDECQGFSNTGSRDILVPIQTQGEWDAFKNNRPSQITSFSADCDITEGGGGGSDDGSSGSGGDVSGDGSSGDPVCEACGYVEVPCCPQPWGRVEEQGGCVLREFCAGHPPCDSQCVSE